MFVKYKLYVGTRLDLPHVNRYHWDGPLGRARTIKDFTGATRVQFPAFGPLLPVLSLPYLPVYLTRNHKA